MVAYRLPLIRIPICKSVHFSGDGTTPTTMYGLLLAAVVADARRGAILATTPHRHGWVNIA